MKKILINAYAVCPNKGSEPGMGWNWIRQIARNNEVYVITEAEFKEQILAVLDTLENKQNFHFYFIEIGEYARRLCWNQGDWRFYFYYRNWQKKAYRQALQICDNVPIDITHQLNMVGYREPGELWKINNLPSVWGPIGGFGGIPFPFLKLFKLREAQKQLVKEFINDFQYHIPYIMNAIKSTDVLIACNSIAKNTLQKFRKDQVLLIGEVGTNSIIIPPNSQKWESEKMIISWIGKNDSRKALRIALEVFKRLPEENYEFHVIGVDFDSIRFKDKEKLKNVTFHSWMPLEQVQEYLAKSHLFLFTSLFEATGTVVLEALSNSIPVLCHDTCGQGDIIDETCGIRVPMKNMEYSISHFTDAIKSFNADRNLLKKLSQGAARKSSVLSWNEKGKLINEVYNSLMKK